jgi:hypothetical protein
MSIELTHQTLVEIGLGHLPTTEQNRLLKRIYDVLEARVGVNVVEQLTTRQASDIDALFDDTSVPDDRRIEQFLDHEIPEYAQLVRDELALMLSYIQRRLRDAHGSIESQQQL